MCWYLVLKSLEQELDIVVVRVEQDENEAAQVLEPENHFEIKLDFDEG